MKFITFGLPIANSKRVFIDRDKEGWDNCGLTTITGVIFSLLNLYKLANFYQAKSIFTKQKLGL
ncbi:MAG: hypothetical protein LBH74_05290 [Nitrososphaerota archaeon]|nr:hypothetical protein [Nitrososphaerota archaeon]